MSGEKKGMDGWALVWSVADEKEAVIVESILEAEGIQVLRKYKEAGDFLKIYLGTSSYGIDLYVPENDLALAEGLLKSDTVDIPEETDTDESI